MSDIYLTMSEEPKYMQAKEPIGFHKCPKNKKREELYCPIYPQEKN
jgi:hypothetical protein